MQSLAWLVPHVELSDAAFRSRHRMLMVFVWLNVPLVVLVAFLNRGNRLGHGSGHENATAHEVMLWALLAVEIVLGVLATRGGRRFRASAVSASLMLGSITLVHAGGGLTDLHFAFFVAIALVGLYQDAVPFAVSVLIVAVHHLVVGIVAPSEVFSDPRAEAHPVPWALMHTGFVLLACGAQVAQWKFAERAQREASAEVEATRAEGTRTLQFQAREATRREQEAVAAAASQADEVQQLASRLDGMLAETARTGERIGDEAMSTITGVRQALDRITAAASQAGADVDLALTDSATAREVMSSLERSVAEISSVAQLIRAVADQTNLLALNATIEAARAGEAGRGFGIVADEVKSLAAETATATARIEETVADVRGRAEAVAVAVSGVGSVLDRVAEAQRQVAEIVTEQDDVVGRARDSLVAAAQEVAGAAAAARAG